MSKTETISKEELQEIMNDVEMTLVNLEFAETMVQEASYDVEHTFSTPDRFEELKLIRRVPFMRNFLLIALDYIKDMRKELTELIDRVYEERIIDKK